MPQLAVQEIVAPSLFGAALPTLTAVETVDPLVEAARLLLWQCVPSNRRPSNPDLFVALEQDELFLRRARSL